MLLANIEVFETRSLGGARGFVFIYPAIMTTQNRYRHGRYVRVIISNSGSSTNHISRYIRDTAIGRIYK